MKPAALPPIRPSTLKEAWAVITAQAELVAAQAEQIARLRERVDHLEERLRSNSQNSSRPPSSDQPDARSQRARRDARKRAKSGRKRGGQPGHEGHKRELMPESQVDRVVDCLAPRQCWCGGTIEPAGDAPRRHQVLELPKVKPEVTEFRVHTGRCIRCKDLVRGALPDGVPEGMLGPRAMSTVAWLSGAFRLSKRSIQELLGELCGLRVCLGTISKTEARVSEMLVEPVEDARDHVRGASIVHMDETGHFQAGRRSWMWLAMTTQVAVFFARFSRGAKVAKEALGETFAGLLVSDPVRALSGTDTLRVGETFAGLLVSDRWSAYGWVDSARRQLCWAHLLRDFAKIEQRRGHGSAIGTALLSAGEELFVLWHDFLGGGLSRSDLRTRAGPIQERVAAQLEEGTRCGCLKTQRTCKRLLKLEVALWPFLQHEGVEPTNNMAERTIRRYVLWRKQSFGTQSERGDRYIERIMTVVATCRLQHRNPLDYLTAAVVAYQRRACPPTLLPDEMPARAAA